MPVVANMCIYLSSKIHLIKIINSTRNRSLNYQVARHFIQLQVKLIIYIVTTAIVIYCSRGHGTSGGHLMRQF